jgi:ubiquinone/menaquinone biosynthesis C-methylase UbiE
MGTRFARWYDTLMKPLETKGLRGIRSKLIAKASGTVLEIGSGTGINFSYYRDVEKVTAIEPEAAMRERSLARAKDADVTIEVLSARAESLPFPDNTFDSVIATLVFCTIADPEKALKEIQRVCKPDGTVIFLEHVRSNNSFLGAVQDKLTPVWRHVCDGCHLNRRTEELIKQAGFKVVYVKRYFKNIFVVVESVNQKSD